MNALTPTAAPSVLVPSNMHEAMDMAKIMAQAGFLAKELQTPGGALFVIEQAMRWNMSPFAVAMETSFIQGKPMFSGKIVAAAVVSSGAVNGRLTYTYTGEGDNRTVTVSGQMRGETEPSTVDVRVREAKTNNRLWQSQPDQQLAYHGARVWARRHAPWVMLGVWSPEEMDTPAEPVPVQNLAAQPAPRHAPPVVDEPEFDWLTMAGKRITLPREKWVKALGMALAALEDAGAVRAWAEERGPMFAGLYEVDAELATNADDAIQARIEFLSNEEDEA
jgi:hypothetical protein